MLDPSQTDTRPGCTRGKFIPLLSTSHRPSFVETTTSWRAKRAKSEQERGQARVDPGHLPDGKCDNLSWVHGPSGSRFRPACGARQGGQRLARARARGERNSGACSGAVGGGAAALVQRCSGGCAAHSGAGIFLGAKAMELVLAIPITPRKFDNWTELACLRLGPARCPFWWGEGSLDLPSAGFLGFVAGDAHETTRHTPLLAAFWLAAAAAERGEAD